MQKNEFDYTVTLRVTHPTLSFRELVELLGRNPRFGWTVGDPRRNSKGRDLGGFREESYCWFEVAEGTDGELARCLRAAVSDLATRENELRVITAGGGEVMLLIYWHAEGDEGETFEPQLLGSMAKLGIHLGLNVLALAEIRATA